MKKHKSLLIVSLCLIVAIASIAGAICVHAAAATTSTVWYKDIITTSNSRSSTPVFHDYTAMNEKIKTVQPAERNTMLALSEQTLEDMTTEGLLVTCLDYPLFGNIVFYDNLTAGFNNVARNYNGLTELLNRDDVGSVIIDFYEQVDYDSVISTDKYGSLRLKYLELMIASDDVLQTMSYEMRQELLDICIEKCTIAVDEYDGKINPITTALIAGKILYMDCAEFKEIADTEPVVMNFLQGMGVGEYSDELWNEIVECVKEYVF